MGLFSFGKKKQKSYSQRTAETFVDPDQQAHLNAINNQAQALNAIGRMPVERVAGLNPTMRNAIRMGTRGGQMQGRFGAGVINMGANQTQGTNTALNYANNAINASPVPDIGTAIGSGNIYADGTMIANAAQGSGMDYQMANRMGANAAQMQPGRNRGINLNQARSIGRLAQKSRAASADGFNSNIATQAGDLAAESTIAQNQGINTGNLNRYINNAVIDSQVDAVSRDISRNLRENELTGNTAAAIGAGQMGSSIKQKLDFGAGQRAADRIADASASIRGNAYNQGLGIEAGRATQNAQLAQGGNQFNASALNTMTSQGLNIAGNQAAQNAGFNQQTNLANQNARNAMINTGVGVAANTAAQNAGFEQQANSANMAAVNAAQNLGYNIGADQLQANLDRSQQTNLSNRDAYNAARQFGTGIGQNAYNTALQNQQFGAGLAQQIGQQGVGNMLSGQNMMNTGVGMTQNAGQYLRDYDQSLLNYGYNRAMAPYNSLQFYNDIVGDPTILNKSQGTTSGKSSGFNVGF